MNRLFLLIVYNRFVYYICTYINLRENMRLLYTFISFLLLTFFSITACAQSEKITKSNEQEVIAGKIFYIHTVKTGETLYSISKAYNVKADVILECSAKKDISLAIGEELRIPKDVDNDNRYFFHTMKQGETLYSVFKKTGVKVESILEHNANLKDINDIAVGTYIRIPKDSITIKEYSKKRIRDKYIVRKSIDSLRKITIIPVDTKPDVTKEELAAFKKKKLEIAFEDGNIDTPKRDSIFRDSIISRNIDIALFLPFYLDLNDTINKITEIDTDKDSNIKPKRHTIYKKSKNFIKFYQGFILACDSLKNKGFNITINTFDTAKNRDSVKNIIDSIDFRDYDFIVGPPYAATFDIAANKAFETRTPIISPLSDKSETTKNNPYVFQLNTSEETVVEKTADYIYKNYSKSNIVVVYPKNYQLSAEAKMVTRLEDSLFSKADYSMSTEIMYTKISFDRYNYYGVKSVLKKGVENIVVVPSKDKTDVYNIIPTLNALTDNYNISLIALPAWQRFNSLDPSTFYKLNTRMLSCYYIDYNNEAVESFVKQFRKKYYSEPSNFSFRAYDLATYFISSAAYGSIKDVVLSNKQNNQLQSCFKFEEDSNNLGKENKGLHILHYTRDYSIHSNMQK